VRGVCGSCDSGDGAEDDEESELNDGLGLRRPVDEDKRLLFSWLLSTQDGVSTMQRDRRQNSPERWWRDSDVDMTG